MKTPYLVQRGKFKKPDKIEGIDYRHRGSD